MQILRAGACSFLGVRLQHQSDGLNRISKSALLKSQPHVTMAEVRAVCLFPLPSGEALATKPPTITHTLVSKVLLETHADAASVPGLRTAGTHKHQPTGLSPRGPHHATPLQASTGECHLTPGPSHRAIPCCFIFSAGSKRRLPELWGPLWAVCWMTPARSWLQLCPGLLSPSETACGGSTALRGSLSEPSSHSGSWWRLLGGQRKRHCRPH